MPIETRSETMNFYLHINKYDPAKTFKTLLFFTAIYCSYARSYDPFIHKIQSKISCEIANNIIERKDLDFHDLDLLTAKNIDTIVSKNAKQDTGVREAFLRPMNYHFFNRAKEDVQKYITKGTFEKIVTHLSSFLASLMGESVELRDPSIINRSMSKLVKIKIDQPLSCGNLDKNTLFELMGAAHHMLQDTTALPHALPVFHGPTLGLTEENIGKTEGIFIGDPMDEWPFSYTPEYNQETFDEVIRLYEDIKKNGYHSPTMYLVESNSEYAKNMLQGKTILKEGREDSHFDTWGKFYEKTEHPYFDRYATYKGKPVKFSDPDLGITVDSYNAFMAECHKRAVLTSSAFTLFILTKALKGAE